MLSLEALLVAAAGPAHRREPALGGTLRREYEGGGGGGAVERPVPSGARGGLKVGVGNCLVGLLGLYAVFKATRKVLDLYNGNLRLEAACDELEAENARLCPGHGWG